MRQDGIRDKVPMSEGWEASHVEGGLLIHPDLFARTDFHLFC
jgi:hypothetical protein